jgi:hypothetical protein
LLFIALAHVEQLLKCLQVSLVDCHEIIGPHKDGKLTKEEALFLIWRGKMQNGKDMTFIPVNLRDLDLG